MPQIPLNTKNFPCISQTCFIFWCLPTFTCHSLMISDYHQMGSMAKTTSLQASFVTGPIHLVASAPTLDLKCLKCLPKITFQMHLQYIICCFIMWFLWIFFNKTDLIQTNLFGGKFSLYCHFIHGICGKMHNIVKFEGGFATRSTTYTCRPLYGQNRSVFEN